MVLTTFDPFTQFERQFDRLAQRSFGGVGMPMDGMRRDGEVVLRFDLPGVVPESIDLTVDRGTLTVAATRDEDYAGNDKLFIRERVTGTFTRRVYLSDDLDTSAVEASFRDGVLSVRIPVAEKAQPSKIEIQRARAAEVTEAADGEPSING
ncbi:MAG TPA: Hsp20/alpha crystallin family protein [Streptosporangiaceae bacterium]|nr:Hsp20/alpha crystallin family protein [Streptosporangiaceae bacterium]